jgi:hypothetical protein
MEEWERLRNPEFVAASGAEKPARPSAFDVTRDPAAFRRAVRTAVFSFLQDVTAGDWESAVSRLQTGEAAVLAEGEAASPESRRVETAFESYFVARGRFRLDPEGRSAKHSHFEEDRDTGELTLAQILVDPDDTNDWEARFVVSLAESRAAQRAVVKFEAVAPVGAV